MFKYLSSAISTITADSSFPYTIDQSSVLHSTSYGLQLYTCIQNKTNEKYSVWISRDPYDINSPNAQSQNIDLYNHVFKLKTLRHPYILKYIDSITYQGKLHLITEYVEPLNLSTYCKDIMRSESTQSGVALGLY